MLKNKDILKKLKDEDSSQYIDSNEEDISKETFIETFKNNIQGLIDSINRFIQTKKEEIKTKKEEDDDVDFTSTESDKHNKIFKYLMKNLALLIAIAFIIVLLVAFFKVFIFSREITKTIDRVQTDENISGFNLSIDPQFSWKDRINQDIQKNRNDLNELKVKIEDQSKKIDTNNKELKDFFKQNSKETIAKIQKNLDEVQNSYYVKLDNINKKLDLKIKEALKDINTTSFSPPSGSFMQIPKSVAPVSKASLITNEQPAVEKKILSGKTLSSEEQKKEEEKILKEKDKRIFLSINIETVDADTSGFDVFTDDKNESNNTVPPIMLRQGMSNGVLITGVSAPTFKMDENPTPVLMTFKGSSIISNFFEQDVENCTATGSVFGNIITRRAEIKVNKISCTFEKDGQTYMVRTNVAGWVYDGNDGRFGVPGILVDSSGAILNDSVIVGALQGFGKFVSSSAQIYAQQGASSVNPNGTPIYSAGQVAQTNMAAGMGEQLASGFDTITQYYQKIIDTLYPYIDVKGGRKITILFDGGETVKPIKYTPLLVNKNYDDKEQDDDMELEIDVESW